MIKFWILVPVFISLSLFYYYNQKSKIKREQKREDRREKHQRYMESLLKTAAEKDTGDKKQAD